MAFLMILYTLLISYSLGLDMTLMNPEMCLDEDDVKEHFVNEPCNNDGDCYNFVANSTVCRRGQCTCADGFIASNMTTISGNTRIICQNPPGPNEQCTGICQNPYKCTNISSNATSIENQDFASSLCLCVAPYVEKDGDCVLECKSDEFFSIDFKCRKRCSASELVGSDGTCKKVSNLGEPCEEKKQCSTPYAVCEKGKCTCSFGFSPNKDNSLCETKSHSCPVGKPHMVNGEVVSCTVTVATVSGSSLMPVTTSIFPGDEGPKQNDTCGHGQFCYASSPYDQTVMTGHCCPIFKPSCPFGKPHPTATCNTLMMGSSAPPSCPLDSHMCNFFSHGSNLDYYVCCPIPCSADQVLVNGRCYPRRQYGDQCEFNEQCVNHNGICAAGICACGKDSNITGPVFSQYCAPTCPSGQTVQSDGKCATPLKIGDHCDPMALQCPTGSHCSQKSNKCICDCGQVKVDDYMCGNKPTCDAIYSNGSSPMVNSDQFKFCIVPGDESALLSSAVKKCPSGQYCAEYMPQLGVCCAVPEKSTCPDGTQASKLCDPNSEKPCDGDQVCLKYLNVAIPLNGTEDTSMGYACCNSMPNYD